MAAPATAAAPDLVATAARPPGRRVPSSEAAYAEVHDFLIDEARLLDEHRLEEWLDLLDHDLLYIAPVRRTRLRAEGGEIDPYSRHLDENYSSIAARIRRLAGDNAFADDPPSRTRRSITNLVVHEDGPAAYATAANLTLLRNRGDAPGYDTLSAARYDTVRRTPAGLRLAQRLIILDQATLGTSNLAIFL